MAGSEFPAKRRCLTSDPEVLVEIVGVAEEPHRIFSNELVLDLILSCLDGKSQLTARLVCHQWNDRILANFHRKFALRLKSNFFSSANKRQSGALKPLSVRYYLRNLDPRLLSSLRFQNWRDGKDRNVFRFTADFLGSSGNADQVRVLSLKGGLERIALNCLVNAANQGLFCNLEELEIEMECGYVYHDDFSDLAVVFPKMKSLRLVPVFQNHRSYVVPVYGQERRNKLHRSRFPKILESFLASAPNLVHLDTTLAFDISERRDLTVQQLAEGDKDAVKMMEPVRKSLTSLKLVEDFDSFRLFEFPSLPNLTSLELCCSFNGSEEQDFKRQRLDWKRLPSLKTLKLQVRTTGDTGETFMAYRKLKHLPRFWAAFLPLPDHAKELWLTGVINSNSRFGRTLGPVLSSKVPRLIVEGYGSVSYLLSILSSKDVEVEVNEPVKGNGPRVLEFHREGCNDDNEHLTAAPISDFASIMNKLRRNWDLVRFKDNTDRDQPLWTEVEFAG